MNKYQLAGIILSGACCGVLPVKAQLQHAHEHGHARLNIAQEGGVVEVELETPAVNLLGFEHAPATDAERSLVREVTAALEDYRTVVSLRGAGAELECSQVAVDVISPLLDPLEDHAHDEHDDHDPGHAGEASSAHANILVRYTLSCAGGAVREIGGTLLGRYPGVAELEVQWLLDSGQGGGELTPGQSVVKVDAR